MNVLLTGANGFLGYYLTRLLLEKKYPVVATGRGPCRLPFGNSPGFTYAEMDFTDPYAVHDVFEKFRPSVLVHAGAMTRPDECERDQWKAYVTNVEGTVTLLLNAEEQKSFFVFLSTDFVFDGEKGMYTETDQPAPVNYYGKTKLEGEAFVQQYEQGYAIARTILVYGKPVGQKADFLGRVKEKLDKGEPVQLVNDQFRTPTFVEDLAAGIVAIMEKRATGIFHLSGKDLLTPFGMAVKMADLLGLDSSLIREVNAANFREPARRPPRTGFILEKAIRELGYDPVPFDEGLRRIFS